MVCHNSPKLSYSFSFLFFFLIWFNNINRYLQIHIFFLMLDRAWYLSSLFPFSFLVTVFFFQLQMSGQFFFFMISISVLNVSFCSCILLLVHWLLCLCSLKSHWAFFKIITLNYFLGILQISISLRSVTGKLLCAFGGVMFPCFFTFLLLYTDVCLFDWAVLSSRLFRLDLMWKYFHLKVSARVLAGWAAVSLVPRRSHETPSV